MSKTEVIYSLILIERLVIIYYLLIHPLIILGLAGINILNGYIIYLLISLLLIYYFVLSNKISEKSEKYCYVVLVFSTFVFFIIVANPIASFISNIIYLSFNLFNIVEIALISSLIAFFFINFKKPIMLRLNHKFIEKERNWKKSLHVEINLSFAIVICVLFLVNYIIPFISIPIPVRERTKSNFSLGFWSYGAPLDDQPYLDTGLANLNDETLEYMGANDVYIIWGVTPSALANQENFLNGHLNFEERLKRCKDHNVKVHLCFSQYFANIWMIESTISNLSEIKTFLEGKNLWGDPVDTITFDIEPVVDYFLSFYGLLSADLLEFASKLNRLRNYDRILSDFHSNISTYINEWNMNVELCHIGINPLDHPDGDDDYYRLWGLIDYPVGEKVRRSYMMYRGGLFSQKMIIDAMDIINDNDIVILSGFEEGEHYRNNFEELINDGRMVKYYSQKNLSLQVWCLYKFINAYGEDAVIDYINAIREDFDATYCPSNIFSLISDCWYYVSTYFDIFFSCLLLLFK